MIKNLVWYVSLAIFIYAVLFFTVWAAHGKTIDTPAVPPPPPFHGASVDKKFEGWYKDETKKARVVIENVSPSGVTVLFFLDTTCYLTSQIDELSYDAVCYRSDKITKPVPAQFTVEQATVDTIYVTFYGDGKPIEYTFKKERELQ